MELVSTIVGPVVNVNILTVHITQKLRYLTSSTEHVKRMKNRMLYLEGQNADIEEHMKENNVNNRKIPARVLGWFEDVKKIKEDADNILSNNIGCFNVKKKYVAGRNTLSITDDIKGLIKESSDIIWSDAQIPFGRVDFQRPASASTSLGNTQIGFNSRDKIFNHAFKFLQRDDDDPVRVIDLCGMGGVGKTTLMKQLKEAAHDNKMFNWIADVVIEKTPSFLAIQKAIAARTGEPLTETDETLRATYLSKRFQVFSERKGKSLVVLDDVWKKIKLEDIGLASPLAKGVKLLLTSRDERSMVVLDDVWKKIKLEDIGLASPLPNGVKLLLTSRDENICQQIAIHVDCVLKVVRVDVLGEGEARDFFSRIAGVSEEHDYDLYQIGCGIVKKCGCLKKNDLDKNVQEAIFMLCGLFPEDSNIPIEELTRYAWGLELLKQVSLIEDARDSTQTSVSYLKIANLLMDDDSDDYECVKMHDLVLAFVVDTVSKGGEDGCRIILHDDFSKWSEANNMSKSCKQISLACKGMSEFPIDFKFTNLTVLKLMQGDESLRFAQDFYLGIEKLQVIAFEKLEHPLVPTSFQCCANLLTLCLHECSLMFDLNCIGNLLNLKVLSFANSNPTFHI